MTDIIASQALFIKAADIYTEVCITIGKPVENRDGFFYARVEFSTVRSLDANIRGVDGINCLEAGLAYIKRVCSINEDPRFYIDIDEPYLGL